MQRRSIDRIYTKLADTYNSRIAHNSISELRVRLVEKYISDSTICMDVGAANGLYAIPLANRCERVIAIDINQRMLDFCRKAVHRTNTVNVDLLRCDISGLGVKKSSVDLLYSFSTLILVPKPIKAFREIYRVLKSNGIAILDITGKHNLSRIHWQKYYKKRGHFGISAHTIQEITDLFSNIGFTIVAVHPSGFLDQWKYIPVIRYFKLLDKIFHIRIREYDVDYYVSRLFPSLANRWHFVLKK